MAMSMMIAKCTAYIVGTALSFVGLAALCDDYLVPVIELICRRFGLPDEVAGATLLAIGSAAPELTIMTVATATGTPDVGFDVLLISAMIAFGAIPALCVLATGEKLELQTWPVVRDTIFYSIGLAALFGLLKKNGWAMKWYDNLILIVLYLVYLVVVSAARLRTKIGPRRKTSNIGRLDEELLQAEKEESKETSQQIADDTEEDEEEHGRIYEIVSKPFNFVFSSTLWVPQSEDFENAKDIACGKIVCSTVMCLIYLAVISTVCYDCVEACMSLLKMRDTSVGGIVLAIGSQVPDTIGAISMAKHGMANGAISSAIGSQVLQMTIGVGLPWLFYNVYHGDLHLNAKAAQESIRVVLPLNALVVLLYFFAVPVLSKIRGVRQTEMMQPTGIVLIVVFLLAMLLTAVL